ncbi:MAG: hypothetical protein ACJART_002014, partial [Maribacter sp.]
TFFSALELDCPLHEIVVKINNIIPKYFTILDFFQMLHNNGIASMMLSCLCAF